MRCTNALTADKCAVATVKTYGTRFGLLDMCANTIAMIMTTRRNGMMDSFTEMTTMLKLALSMYSGEDCRICERVLTPDDNANAAD